MKRKSKFLKICCCILTAASIFAVMSVSSFAQSQTDEADVSTLYGEAYENGIAESENEVQEEVNVFALIYEGLTAHSGEILSALTFIGTLIVGFAYKKGLLPLLTGAISNIQSAVGKMRDESAKEAESAKYGIEIVSERLAGVENSLSIFTESLSALEQKLQSEAQTISERDKFRTVMSSQIDMLYDIFMASALPQYQKDAVGARVQRMKEELSSYEKIEK